VAPRGRRIAATRIRARLERLLEASSLCAIATVAGPRAHVNTAYFAWSADFHLVWISDPAARHSRNLEANASAAVAVFDSTEVWGKPDAGLQLFGRGRRLAGRAALRARNLYIGRFPAYPDRDLGAYAWYEFRPQTVKLFDEAEFGAGVFVTAKLDGRGAVEWTRTESVSGAA
jgi:uncharacterized protein YhbP (UPF0306 family)